MSPSLPRAPWRKKGGRKRGLHPLIIAAIAIVIPLIIIYYAFAHSLPFIGSNYTDYAIVSNSVNVRGGSPVRIAGIDVGQVTHVSNDGNATKIAFTLDAAARPLHNDASVTIRDRLFLEGGYYLDLEPGSPSAPVTKQGFTIQEDNTATPVQFFKILSIFDSSARNSLANLLRTANVAFSPSPGAPESDSGAGGFKEAIPALTPVLRDTSEISQALTGTHAGDVETFLSASSDVTTTLAQHRLQLADMFDKLDTVAGTLAGEDDAVGQSIADADGILKQAPTTLTAINRSLGPVDVLSADLTPSLQQSPPLLHSLNTELAAVNSVIAPGQRSKLIGSVRTLLTNFPATATSLANVFPPLQAAASCLAERVTPLFKETVQDGNLSTGDPVWKDLVHMLPNLAAASGNFDANGPYLRVLFGLGSDTVPSSFLGSLPGISNLVGAFAGSGSSDTLQGIAPQWVGDLTAADFRPDVSCTSQPLPTNLVANPAEADK